MTPEQIGTILGPLITNVLTGSGLAFFLFYLFRGLKRKIGNLKRTIE